MDDPQLDPGPVARRHPRAGARDRRDGRRSSTTRTRSTRSTCRTAAACCPGLPEDLVVEVYGRTIDGWIEPQPAPPLPRHVLGLIEVLGEYQFLAAEAAWSGNRRDAVRALAANPLVRTLPRAERLYAELAAAHRAHLPATAGGMRLPDAAGYRIDHAGARHAHVRPGRPPARRERDRAGHGAAAARQRHDGADRLPGRASTTPTCPARSCCDAALAELGADGRRRRHAGADAHGRRPRRRRAARGRGRTTCAPRSSAS